MKRQLRVAVVPVRKYTSSNLLVRLAIIPWRPMHILSQILFKRLLPHLRSYSLQPPVMTQHRVLSKMPNRLVKIAHTRANDR